MKKTKIIITAIVLVAVMAIAVGAYLLFVAPPDWQHGAKEANTGVDKDGHPWIGAQKPEMVIHEYLDYECPHCAAAHKKVRSLIARDLDRIRLVRHDYARMKCFGSSSMGAFLLCGLVRASICAAEHMSYWQWNDELIANPRHDTELTPAQYIDGKRKKFKLPKKEFNDCIMDDKTVQKANAIYAETRAAKVQATPSYIVDGKVLNAMELVQLLNSF